jgi:hypothetical protein
MGRGMTSACVPTAEVYKVWPLATTVTGSDSFGMYKDAMATLDGKVMVRLDEVEGVQLYHCEYAGELLSW